MLTGERAIRSNLDLVPKVQAVTQSLKLCYAGCYARLFYANKSVVSVIQTHVTTLLITLCDRARNKNRGVAQLVARYLGVTLTARSIVDHCATIVHLLVNEISNSYIC